MRKFVTITTPIPTLEEVAKWHKISKARQKRILEIMRSPVPARVSARKRAATGSSNGHLRNEGGAAQDSVQSKKSRQAVVI
jgi:predicted Fe-S protein YdhL (DUF1289 family)